MTEKIQIIDEIGWLVWFEGLEIVLFRLSWATFEVIIQNDSFIVADDEVAVCDGE